MTKQHLIRRLVLLTVTILLLSLCSCKTIAVFSILEDPDHYYVPQGDSMCGYTAFYMALKFYGDHEKKTFPDYQETIDFPNKVTPASKVVVNIRASDGGNLVPTQTGLATAANSIYYYDENNQRLKLYNTVISNTNSISLNDRTSREARFKNELYDYLFNGTPVITHLDRVPVYLSGHYIVLIGMDVVVDEDWHLILDENGDPQVTDLYYMDPYMKAADWMRQKSDDWGCEAATANFNTTSYNANYDTCFVQKISYDAFMDGSWYKSPSSTYNAYWDGKYLLFTY